MIRPPEAVSACYNATTARLATVTEVASFSVQYIPEWLHPSVMERKGPGGLIM